MDNILADRIQERLKALNMNVTQAAVRSGLGKTAVRDIIAGKSKSPTVATLASLAETLQCTVSYLLGDANHPLAFRPSENEILDIRLSDITSILKVGVFQKPANELISYGKNLLYGHPIAPDHSVDLYEIGDDSMNDAGFLRGDVITTAMPYNIKDFQAYKNRYVVVTRIVSPHDLHETSLREVVLGEDGFMLTTRPKSGSPDIIDLEFASRFENDPAAYVVAPGEVIVIEGFVIRVVRDIPSL
ncbi:helix-turn-helix transcriptional regulator [Rhizobium sp. YJ-22]|uniref:helix-turn-helix domain-containing protein n=1 Tax=Rhizobium sp. YJ-22 TaxID=3037556 RepID=UPI00241224DC|nr:helix-turn-helix transcriptional regulator [Rhizobium sp. YJ-22]MDG3577151.1 helix-turn-helix transcriptional regulator [Rhizobium sp. YJ-22]